jgi:hypothetical protein
MPPMASGSAPAASPAPRGSSAIRGRLTEVVRRWRDAGNLPPESDVEAIGQVLFSLVPGFLLQRLILGDVEIGRYAAGLAAVTGTARPG